MNSRKDQLINQIYKNLLAQARSLGYPWLCSWDWEKMERQLRRMTIPRLEAQVRETLP